nr:Wzy polymerase domain-containing protein [uncultured Pseudomonas sp.]
MSSSLRYAISSFLFFLAWTLPYHYYPWVSASQDLLAFLALIIILKIKHIKILIAIIIALLTLLAPSITKLYHDQIFFGDLWVFFGYLFAFCLSYITGRTWSPKERSEFIDWLFFFSIAASLLSVFLALMQWLRMDYGVWIAAMPPNSRPFGNMAQPNNLATLLCFSLVCIYFFYEQKKITTHFLITLAIIFIFGIALTQSRTALVSVFLISLLWLYKKDSLDKRIKIWHFSFIITTLLCLAYSIPRISTALLLNSSSLAERASSLERIGIYKQFAIAIWDGPTFGYGANQIAEAQLLTAKKISVPIQVEYTHNFALDLMTWFGLIPGLLITLAIFLHLLKNTYESKSKEKIFSLFAITPIITHSLLEYPHAYAFFLIPMGLLFGISSNQLKPANQENSNNIEHLFPIACAVLVLTTWHEYLQIESDARIMRLQSAGINIISEEPTPKIYLLTQLSGFIKFAKNKAHSEMTKEELSWMRKVSYRYPYPPCIFRYSIALALNGFEPESLDTLKNIKRLYGPEKYEEAVKNLSHVPGVPQRILTLAKEEIAL